MSIEPIMQKPQRMSARSGVLFPPIEIRFHRRRAPRFVARLSFPWSPRVRGQGRLCQGAMADLSFAGLA